VGAKMRKVIIIPVVPGKYQIATYHIEKGIHYDMENDLDGMMAEIGYHRLHDEIDEEVKQRIIYYTSEITSTIH
jgi:hypothetical protein